MKLIVGHSNMDMDCLGSLALAKKLYPDHQLVASRHIHPVAKKLFKLYENYFSFLTLKDIKDAEVESLVVVDTRSKKRIAEYTKVFASKPVKIIVYDHHPSDSNDIETDDLRYRNYGSNTTILGLELMEKKIPITPDEATIALTGIFADTGNFTHENVTIEDFRVAHYLMNQGAQISVIREFLKTLKEEYQLTMFHEILNRLVYREIKGHLVVFSFIEMENQVSGLASVVEKVFEVENPDAFFAVFSFIKSKSSIVIARSQKEAINLHDLLGALGGGGHAMAASVVFKGRNGEEVSNDLLLFLEEKIIPAVTAEHIMSRNVQNINENWTLKDASIFLESINHTGAPVTDDEGRIKGFITLRDIMKGRKADQMHAPVRGYMTVRVVTAEIHTPIREVEKLMYSNDIGHLPIVQDSFPVGIVSRGDLLKFIKQHRPNKLVDSVVF